jgi:hypothetical protein
LVVLGLLFVWIAVAAVYGWQALGDARAARIRLVDARSAAVSQDAAGVRADALAARSGFTRAAGRLRAPVLAPFRFVPVANRQLAVASALASSGVLASRAAVHVAEAVEARPVEGWTVRGGRLDLPALADAADRLAAAETLLVRARGRLSSVRLSLLVPGVSGLRSKGVREIAAAERTARNGAMGLRLAATFAGSKEPRRYFVALGNLAELRGTGGFMGYFGILEARDGKLSFRAVGRPGELLPQLNPRALRAPRWFVQAYARRGALRDWRNVNVSTDFPTVARIVTAGLMQPGSVGRVDGVIEIDPIAIESLLRLTGPVSVPPWPEPITASNVTRVTLFDVYVRFADLTKERVDFLGRVADAIFQRVVSSGLRVDAPAVRELASATAGGHIQAYATRDWEQEDLSTLGLARGVGRTADATDTLGVVSENWSPSKIDWFLRRSVSYRVRLDPQKGSARGRLQVVLRNDAPASGLPDYILGTNASEVPYANNRQLLLLLRPRSDQLERDVRVDGRAGPVSADEESTLRSYSRFVTVAPRGGRVVVQADFEAPTGVTGGGRHRTYRLHVLRQPVAHADRYSIRILPTKGWKIDGRTTFEGPLTKDVVLEIHLTQSVRAWLFENAVLDPIRTAQDLFRRL